MPRCVCGRGEMKIRRFTCAEYKPDGSDEQLKLTKWEAFCNVCGVRTNRYESIEEAVQAFKDFNFVDDDVHKEW